MVFPLLSPLHHQEWTCRGRTHAEFPGDDDRPAAAHAHRGGKDASFALAIERRAAVQ